MFLNSNQAQTVIAGSGKGDVAEYAKENGITDTLVLYGTQNFVSDTTLSAAASIVKA